jgi:lipopolysaccharide/colanic/teichoic acid biosynthesis glycosyltransferase
MDNNDNDKSQFDRYVYLRQTTTDIPIIRIRGDWLNLFNKRLFDMVLSLMAIVILSPLLVLIAILVKATSKGPVLFKDVRIGKKGKTIKVYKFRSMYVDAESRLKSYLTPEQYKSWLIDRKIDNDPRITKFGNFIRKTSLDELPQLFNIFFGSMSLVGPRPITERELMKNFTPAERSLILSVRPGLTGYWQVSGRSDADYDSGKRQALEIEYFSRRGFFFDLGILFKTIPAVLKRKGAQ